MKHGQTEASPRPESDAKTRKMKYVSLSGCTARLFATLNVFNLHVLLYYINSVKLVF